MTDSLRREIARILGVCTNDVCLNKHIQRVYFRKTQARWEEVPKETIEQAKRGAGE